MAGTCNFFPHVTGSTPSRSAGVASLYWKTQAKSNGVSVYGYRQSRPSDLALAEGPSCIFVGPVETASKETLEALYCQARDAYYSGNPLIVDDMFDKVELELRRYGSKSVVKYPRCSLRRQSTYSDAEEDLSQVLALVNIWIFFLFSGGLTFLVPTFYTLSLTYEDAIYLRFSLNNTRSASELLEMADRILFMGLGFAIGYPIILASVRALQRLWTSDLVALKGSCPNCGEEVFAFVRTDKSEQSPHRADCHVCECTLEFRAKVERSTTGPGKRWVYGRVYLVPGTAKKRPRWS